MYAIVKDDTVERYIKKLPQKFIFEDGSQTGNFDTLTSEAQIKAGYYPVKDVRPSVDVRIESLALDSVKVGETEVTRTYVVAPKEIETVRVAKINQITSYRNSLLKSSLFEHDGRVFNFDERSADNATQLESSSDLAGFPSPFSWTDRDGEEYPMTEAGFHTFVQSMTKHKLTIEGMCKYHVGQVKALATALEIVDYDHSGGWGNYVDPVDEDEFI